MFSSQAVERERRRQWEMDFFSNDVSGMSIIPGSLFTPVRQMRKPKCAMKRTWGLLGDCARVCVRISDCEGARVSVDRAAVEEPRPAASRLTSPHWTRDHQVAKRGTGWRIVRGVEGGRARARSCGIRSVVGGMARARQRMTTLRTPEAWGVTFMTACAAVCGSRESAQSGGGARRILSGVLIRHGELGARGLREVELLGEDLKVTGGCS